MKYRDLLLLACAVCAFNDTPALAQGGPPAIPSIPETPVVFPPADNEDGMERTAPGQSETAAPVARRTVIPQIQTGTQPEKLQSFEFAAADLDTVMTMYCEWTGKIYLKNDSVNASISLKADKLSIPECIDVVEAILAMNNIAIVPFGEKFIKVVNVTDYQKEGAPVGLDTGKEYTGTDRLVTQLIQLENVKISDVQAAIQHLMHSYGSIQTMEGSNSLLVTDTESNILRIRELVEFIDQASAKIEPRFYQIAHADAVEIAGILNEIIGMAQQGQGSPAGRTISRTPTGVIRARTVTTAARTQAAVSASTFGGPTIIQGDVKVMSDERTNLILIFSQKENYEFFDKIISTFDVEVEPAVTFEVVNLEYADAEELAGTLNDLVGAAQSSRSLGSGSASGSSSRSRTSSSRTSSSRSSSRSPSAGAGVPGTVVTPNASPDETASIQNLNQLSEETKILADTRSNSILLMGMKSDIAAIKQVIASLDVMLEQVIIEAAIFEIGLDDELRHGIDWLYRAQGDERIGAWDGNSLITNAIQNIAAGSLTYYQNFFDIDTQMLINLSKTDTDARLVSTPVIMTTDNTEASLSIGQQRPVVTSTDTYASNLGGQRSNYEYKDIGIQLTVTPRINPQRFVVMEINQRADDVGPIVSIDNNEVPVILNREFEASIAVPDGGTVVLGGLMRTDIDDTVTKIPILGDIPLIGRYLFSSVTKTEYTEELIVLMTPYVMNNMDELADQTERLYKGTTLQKEDWKNSWSESTLRYTSDDARPAAKEVPRSAQRDATAPAGEVDAELTELLNTM